VPLQVKQLVSNQKEFKPHNPLKGKLRGNNIKAFLAKQGRLFCGPDLTLFVISNGSEKSIHAQIAIV